MNVLYRIVTAIGVPLFKLLYQPTIINKENIPMHGRIILAGNHTNNLDCALLISSTKRTIHFLAKKELHDTKLGGWFFKSMATIPVDRKVKNPDAMKSAIEVLNNEEVIGIFPEGTTNKTKDIILPFKYGAISMANKTDSYIVPFSITGKYKLFQKKVRIKFDKPYKLKSSDLSAEKELLENKIIKLIKENQV